MMTDQETRLAELKQLMARFKTERNWEQFNTPKNLSMAIAIEAGGLMEHFLWADGPTSVEIFEKNRAEIENEIADIFACTVSFCAQYNIDLSSAFERKMAINIQKYPIEKAKGTSKKYNEL